MERPQTRSAPWLSLMALTLFLALALLGLNHTSAGFIPLTPDAPTPSGAHLRLELSPRLQDIFAGDTAELTVNITNDGAVTISGLATSGSSIAACNKNGLGTLAPGETLNYTCQKTNVGESSLEEVNATGSAAGVGSYQQTSDAFIKVSKPELIILKRPTEQTVRPGGTARFSIVVRNEGNTVLANVKVIDNNAPDCGLDPAVPLNLAPGERREYTCRLDGVMAPVTTVATVQGINPGNQTLNQASDVGWVDVLDLAADLSSTPTSVEEPGTEVVFKATVINPGSVPVNLVGLTTNKYGNLFDAGNELVPAATNGCLPGPDPITISPNGGSVSCDFVGLVSGQPSDFSVMLTATASSAGGDQVTATADTTVPIVDIPPVIDVNLSADPPIVASPGATVKFTVRISNFSAADGVIVTELEDAAIGDLNGRGTCAVPTALIGTGGSYECQYSAQVTGTTGQEKVRTVTATAMSDDPVPGTVLASDSITIPISDLPVQKVILPGIFMDGDVEPNNTCALAYRLRLNRQYFFLPPPTYIPQATPPLQDYYRFELEETANVVVRLTNFVPLKGQLIVRRDVSCADGNVPIVGQNANASMTKTLDLGPQPAGEYFIQIINDGPAETEEFYGLIVNTQ